MLCYCPCPTRMALNAPILSIKALPFIHSKKHFQTIDCTLLTDLSVKQLSSNELKSPTEYTKIRYFPECEYLSTVGQVRRNPYSLLRYYFTIFSDPGRCCKLKWKRKAKETWLSMGHGKTSVDRESKIYSSNEPKHEKKLGFLNKSGSKIEPSITIARVKNHLLNCNLQSLNGISQYRLC